MFERNCGNCENFEICNNRMKNVCGKWIGWIDASEEKPDNDRYVLVALDTKEYAEEGDNVTTAIYYPADEEGEEEWLLGHISMITCEGEDLKYVKAWREIPEYGE